MPDYPRRCILRSQALHAGGRVSAGSLQHCPAVTVVIPAAHHPQPSAREPRCRSPQIRASPYQPIAAPVLPCAAWAYVVAVIPSCFERESPSPPVLILSKHQLSQY